jgi:hypothetical protein
MERSPRPPPPVYQSEILGEAIYLAGTVKRRDWRVGSQTTVTRIGNQVAPGIMDAVAGAIGVRPQQTNRQDVAHLRDPNTFRPTTKASGAHGPFDGESLSNSAQWWLSKTPLPVQLGLGLLALGFATVAAGRRR